MSVPELPTTTLLGISVALVALVAVAVSLVASPERTAAVTAPRSRPVPPIDAVAPETTETATFALG